MTDPRQSTPIQLALPLPTVSRPPPPRASREIVALLAQLLLSALPHDAEHGDEPR